MCVCVPCCASVFDGVLLSSELERETSAAAVDEAEGSTLSSRQEAMVCD